jgi:hypothetical protein
VIGVLAATHWGLLAQAEGDGQLFLGEDFLPWMVLAFGAAMVIGPLVALVRPPTPSADDDSEQLPERPPVGRTVTLIVIGAIAAVWGLASLLG